MAKTKAQMAADKAAKLAANKNVAQNAASTALAVVGKATLPEGLKLVRRVTMPALVMKEPGKTYCLHILDAFHISKVEGKEIDEINAETGKKTGRKVRERPATVCAVGDVQTGESFMLLVPAVVQKNLEQEYPEADGKWGYVGKVFAIANKGKRTSTQRYHDFEIAEVDASGLTAKAQAQAADK